MAGQLHVDEPLDGVRRLTIDNADKRNALDHPILDAIAREVAAAQTDQDVRCVVLTGAHGMFSSGYDIGGIPDDRFAQEAEQLVAHPFTAAIDALEASPLPTVAALSGPTIGGGLELALACDLRLARDGIALGMPPARLGLVYSHTGLRRFVRAIGEPRTRELFLRGHTIDARTALGWGLVHDVVVGEELEDVALGVARELAANSPLSIAGTKEILRTLEREGGSGALDPATENRLLALREASFATHDLREGVAAFAEKRPPRWTGR